jgi:serine protease Do
MSKKIKIVHEKTSPETTKAHQVSEVEAPSYSSKKSTFWRVLGIIFISLIFGGIGSVLAQKIVVPFIEQKYLTHEEKIVIPEKEEKIIIKENSATIEAVKKVTPAVVSIVSTRNAADFFGDVFVQQSGGTGFILTSDGLILTNKHVAGDKKTKYSVLTSDGKDLAAYVLTTDPVNDIAVLKVDAKNLPVVEIGDSSELVPGQKVIAIGNALGEYQNTVTAGVVSAVGRAVVAGDETGAERIEGAIQTDAAINPGNSGGPLINVRGQVVGINTAIDKGGQTIGFAIPVDVIKPVDNFIENIRKVGKIIRPMIGIRYIPITKELASLNNLPVSEGALVYKGNEPGALAVIPGSPADEAGIEEEDIVIAIDDQKIDKDHSLSYLIQKYKPGDEIELIILRNKKERKTKLKLTEMTEIN